MKTKGKRSNFLSIQLSHHVPCENAEPIRVRTGYEKVIAYRTSEIFACPAKRAGTVIDIDDKLKLVKIAYEPVKIKIDGTYDTKMSSDEIRYVLNRNKSLVSVRATKDIGKYKVGQNIQVTPTTVLRIVEIKTFNSTSEIPGPLTNALSDTEKNYLDKSGSITRIKFEPIEQDSRSDIDVFKFGYEHTYVSGSYIQQNIVINVKVGDKVKPNDIIAYNSGFFKPDEYSENAINWCHGVPATIALLESDTTYEDSNAITESFGKKLAFSPSHIRDLRLTKKTIVHSMVNVGDHVQTTDLLCVIEDGDVDALTMSDDPATVEFLANLNRKAPKAKYAGTIADIDVLYSCAIEDMHPTMQELVKAINARKNKIAKFARDSDKSINYLPPEPMPVGSKFRGIEFAEDTVVIFITISESLNHSTGDKCVVYSAAKTITAQVLEKEPSTQSGTPIDMLFSGRSIMARIINSPILAGTLERVLMKMEDDIVGMYFDEK